MIDAPAERGVEDGQRRVDGDVVGDELCDHRLHRRAATSSVFMLKIALRRAELGLFAVDELGVDEQAVLEAVDAGGGRVGKADRAQVAGDLGAVTMRGGDGGVELAARDVVVDLERRGAGGAPEVDEARDRRGVGLSRELHEDRLRAFDVGTGDVEARAGGDRRRRSAV